MAIGSTSNVYEVTGKISHHAGLWLALKIQTGYTILAYFLIFYRNQKTCKSLGCLHVYKRKC